MTVLLIPGVFLALVLVLLSQRGIGLGEGILKASLLLMLGIVVGTEGLSRLEAITFRSLSVLWAGGAATIIGVLLYQFLCRRGWYRLRRKVVRLRRRPPMTPRAAVYATITSLVIVLTLLVAVRQYPYDNDSVSYHMSRVANWINQKSVEFYPTVNQRQNFFSPGATYVILHVQLLSGTDKYSVAPQYTGMLLCFMLVAMLASRLGVGRTGQCLCVALAATIPILIGQSHCNQNELVFSALLLGFAWFLVRFAERPRWSRAIWCGLAFGLALYTKGSAFFFGAAIGLPIGVLALLRALPEKRAFARTTLQLVVAVCLGLALFTPFLTRCRRDGNTYFDNEFSTEVRNSRIGWDVLKANVLRNAAFHLGMTDEQWNARIVTWVGEAVGDQAGNIESTFRSLPFKMQPTSSCFYSSNPLHLLLVLLSWLLVPFARCDRKLLLVAYLGASVLAALFFNLCLKYQYWGIRLQLPGLLLSIPLSGLALDRTRLPGVIRNTLQVSIALVLFIGALPALVFDNDLPLFQKGRAPLIFRDAESIRFGAAEARFDGKSDYSKVASFLQSHDPDEVGLILPRGNGCQDYHWWVAFGTHAGAGRPRLRHVASETWPPPVGQLPEWVIVRTGMREPVVLQGVTYEKVFQAGGCRVFRRLAPPIATGASTPEQEAP